VLVENTERFAKGLPANNALLWGARGMGKSSLVKAAHAAVNAEFAAASKRGPLKLVEIHREDIESLPALMALTRNSQYRFIVFCDDLSFDTDDTTYKSLKAVLEGGIHGGMRGFHQRRFSHAARAPQQRIVGRQSAGEAFGILDQRVAHAIDALEQRHSDAVDVRHRRERAVGLPDIGVGHAEVRRSRAGRRKPLQRVGNTRQHIGVACDFPARGRLAGGLAD
jgi:hypothetical protein